MSDLPGKIVGKVSDIAPTTTPNSPTELPGRIVGSVNASAQVPAQQPSFMENVGTGVLDRLFGAAQLGGHIAAVPEQPMASNYGMVPEETQKTVDKFVQDREQKIQREGGGGWGRVVGNVLADTAITAPITALSAGAGALPTLGSRVLQGLGLGALGGGISSALTPTASEDFAGSKLGQIAGGAATGGVLGGVLGGISSAIARNSPEAVEASVKHLYTKGIRPTVAGKRTASQLNTYMDQARSGIDSIVANKPNLQFIDPKTGIQVIGEKPTTLEQFGEAIEQTKRNIFQKYDAMARASGEKGVEIGLEPAANELDKIASAKSLSMLYPQKANYARELAARLRGEGFLPVMDAQEAIQHLNTSLKAFYNNQTYDTAISAAIDSVAANNLRKGLDTAIEGTVAPGYQALKNEYGALKALEKDVLHRTVVDARKGAGLIGSLGDLFSAEEFTRAIVTLNPKHFATGAAVKGLSHFLRRYRDPNRAVEKLFDLAEKGGSQTAVPTANAIGVAAPVVGGIAGGQAASAIVP